MEQKDNDAPKRPPPPPGPPPVPRPSTLPSRAGPSNANASAVAAVRRRLKAKESQGSRPQRQFQPSPDQLQHMSIDVEEEKEAKHEDKGRHDAIPQQHVDDESKHDKDNSPRRMSRPDISQANQMDDEATYERQDEVARERQDEVAHERQDEVAHQRQNDSERGHVLRHHQTSEFDDPEESKAAEETKTDAPKGKKKQKRPRKKKPRYESHNNVFAALQNEHGSHMRATVGEISDLLFAQVPDKKQLRCRIERLVDENGKNVFAFIVPVPSLDGGKDKQLTLMLGKKKEQMLVPGMMAWQTNYLISLDQADFCLPFHHRSAKYFGKLQSCNSRNAYRLYDAGHSTKRAKGPHSRVPYADEEEESVIATELRREFAGIRFFRAPKSLYSVSNDHDMVVAIPSLNQLSEEEISKNQADFDDSEKCYVTQDGDNEEYFMPFLEMKKQVVFQPRDEADSILAEVENVCAYPWQVESKPKVNCFAGAKGADKRPSIEKDVNIPLARSTKNFDLKWMKGSVNHDEDAERADDVALGMGRVGQDRFELVVRHPFSPFQAYGIALARLDFLSSVQSRMSRKFSM